MWGTSRFYFLHIEKVRIPDLCPLTAYSAAHIVVYCSLSGDQNIKACHSYTKGHPMCYCFLSFGGRWGVGEEPENWNSSCGIS